MEQITVKGASVDFYKEIRDGINYYIFDSSELGPPEPMVNAMAGLQMLKEGEVLEMINHSAPAVLFSRVEKEFDHEVLPHVDEKVRILFRRKKGVKSTTDFTNTRCGGC